MSTRLPGVLLLLGIGGAASGAELLSAGSHDLVTAHLKPAIMNFKYSTRPAPDSAVRPGSSQQLVIEEAPPSGGSATLRVIHHIGNAANYFIDTLEFKRDGLVPLWEHLYQVSATRKLKLNRMITYRGTRAEVVTQADDSAPRTDTLRFDAPPFGWNQLEQVVQSVPHREGYHTVVDLYSEGDNAQELDTISVVGRTTDGTGWKVRFADNVFSAVYVVDAKTRELRSSESNAQKPVPMVAYAEITTAGQ